MNRIKQGVLVLAAAGVMSTPHAVAHGTGHDADQKPAAIRYEQKPWGIAGDPARVTRTIRMNMSDEMKYHPARISVKAGETIRFELRNDGKTLHEMVIGTKEELEEHAALMRKFPNMEHDEPYMAHVPPGKVMTIVWQFNRPGEFMYACLIPGHYEAGMVGKVAVK